MVVVTIYGYIRENVPCPTAEQLNELSDCQCQEFLLESSNLKQSPELARLLTVVEPGDIIVSTNLSVLGKTLPHLAVFFQTLKERKVRYVSIQDGLDTNDASTFYHYLELFSKNDKEIKRLITCQSLEVRRNNGDKIGRPALTEETIQQIKKLFKEKRSLREIALACNISLGTAHKYVTEFRQQSTRHLG